MTDNILRMPSYPLIRLIRHIFRVLAAAAVAGAGVAVMSLGRLEILEGTAWKATAAGILGAGLFIALVLLCLSQLMAIQIELVEACREAGKHSGAGADESRVEVSNRHAGAAYAGMSLGSLP